jgi:prepilin-type N-terminal cleavage/methylation domain-containing protein
MSKTRLENTKGWTLLEISIVVIIIGVMASYAWPKLNNVIERSRTGEAEQALIALYASQKRYQLETGNYTSTINSLDVSLPGLTNFNTPTVNAGPTLASVQRSNNAYTLHINTAGSISCTPAGSTCNQIGY